LKSKEDQICEQFRPTSLILNTSNFETQYKKNLCSGDGGWRIRLQNKETRRILSGPENGELKTRRPEETKQVPENGEL